MLSLLVYLWIYLYKFYSFFRFINRSQTIIKRSETLTNDHPYFPSLELITSISTTYTIRHLQFFVGSIYKLVARVGHRWQFCYRSNQIKPMIDKNLTLTALAKMSESEHGSDQCDWLEALIVKASIELRYTLEEIGNDNDDLNKSQICNMIKTEETTSKRYMREQGIDSYSNYL